MQIQIYFKSYEMKIRTEENVEFRTEKIYVDLTRSVMKKKIRRGNNTSGLTK